MKKINLNSKNKFNDDNNSICIIGMACKFPKCNNINEFYHSPNLNSTNNDSKFHNNSKHHKHNSNIENINLDKLWQNLGKSSKDELNKNNKKVENSKNYNESFFIR